MGIYTFILIILYCYASVKWVMLFPVSPTPATCFLLYTFKETWYLYGIILHFIKHLLPLLAFKEEKKLNKRFVKACLIFGTKIPAFVTRTIENCMIWQFSSNLFLCYKYTSRAVFRCIYDRAIGHLFIDWSNRLTTMKALLEYLHFLFQVLFKTKLRYHYDCWRDKCNFNRPHSIWNCQQYLCFY